MTLLEYLLDRLFDLVAGVLALAIICGIGSICGLSDAAVVSIAVVAAIATTASITVGYLRRRRFLADLSLLAGKVDHVWELPALIEEPDTNEGRTVYRALQRMGRLAADEVADARKRTEDYRAYVEAWVHEVKTPVAAAELVANRLEGDDARILHRQLDRIRQQVEQVLWYARLSSVESDYAIRKISLPSVLNAVCRDNARFLIERGTVPRSEVPPDMMVFADEKWLAFIISQMVVNAAKYGARTVVFAACEKDAGTPAGRTELQIADDGKGIPAADVPRVFDRGFTGENGHAAASSTGMGLYLAAVMCRKMGIGIRIASEEGAGTRLVLSFPHDSRRRDSLRREC